MVEVTGQTSSLGSSRLFEVLQSGRWCTAANPRRSGERHRRCWTSYLDVASRLVPRRRSCPTKRKGLNKATTSNELECIAIFLIVADLRIMRVVGVTRIVRRYLQRHSRLAVS